MVDKFVGDEAIGLFFAGISGTEHTAAAIRAGHALLDGVGRADATRTAPSLSARPSIPETRSSARLARRER